MLSWVLYIIIILVLTFLVVHFIGQGTEVSGNSMRPTLEDGDKLVVDKISYRFINPGRFDVVVFPFQYKKDTYYIKRIIGLPGETVQIIEGQIYINSTVLQENYGNETIEKSGLASGPITLGEDEYFVLGDNRNNSSDSREPSVGNIRREAIVGKALFRIWPLSRFGLVR
ncbi:MAG: signal peptidase I [Lachnospiraceae bacterium]|nr:signal peptidase I [Lachnospiraceae bacterium]